MEENKEEKTVDVKKQKPIDWKKVKKILDEDPTMRPEWDFEKELLKSVDKFKKEILDVK